MAYSKKSKKKSATGSYKRSGNRTRSSNTGSRRSSKSSPQTIRIVVEQAAPAPLTDGAMQTTAQSRRASF